jgi:feruloyl esterase
VNYFDRVLAANGGPQQVSQFARFFLAPGVGHCGGGDGPSPVDLFETLVNWVEKGVAPETIPASRRRENGTVMSRPLCAYPNVAKWTGTGSTDEAANFVCVDGQQRSADFTVAPRRN